MAENTLLKCPWCNSDNWDFDEMDSSDNPLAECFDCGGNFYSSTDPSTPTISDVRSYMMTEQFTDMILKGRGNGK